MNSKALIVCYSFPPNPGVGGRRWAKLASYLIKLGWNITVLSKKPEAGDKSPWNEDVSGIETVHLIPDYPTVLNGPVESILQKISYRLALLQLKKRTIGNYYDRAALIENQYLTKLEELYQSRGFQKIIVTGAPFSLLYYTAEFKKKHPEILFIADIRDSWLSDDFYGFGLLSEKRKQEEKRRLEVTLASADTVLVPYDEMREAYKNLAPKGADIRLLPHGTDPAHIQPRKPELKTRLVHFGSHYHGLEEVFNGLAETAASHENIQLSFFTTDYKYRHLFEKNATLNHNVFYNRLIAERDVFSEMSVATAAILFTPKHMKDFVSTKFMEAISARVPVLVLGVWGKAAEFVESNHLGVFISSDRVASDLAEVLDSLPKLNYNANFDISPYLFSKQADLVESLLNNNNVD